MNLSIKPTRTDAERAEEVAIRRQHAEHPVQAKPADAIASHSFAAILKMMAIDPPALSRLENGKTLNPTLATLHRWAEALGQKLSIRITSDN